MTAMTTDAATLATPADWDSLNPDDLALHLTARGVHCTLTPITGDPSTGLMLAAHTDVGQAVAVFHGTRLDTCVARRFRDGAQDGTGFGVESATDMVAGLISLD